MTTSPFKHPLFLDRYGLSAPMKTQLVTRKELHEHEDFIRENKRKREEFIAKPAKDKLRFVENFLFELGALNIDAERKLDTVKWFIFGGFGHENSRLFRWHRFSDKDRLIGDFLKLLQPEGSSLSDDEKRFFHVLFCDDPSNLRELSDSLSRVDFSDSEEKFAKYIRLIPEDCLRKLVSDDSQKQLPEKFTQFLAKKSNSVFASGFVRAKLVNSLLSCNNHYKRSVKKWFEQTDLKEEMLRHLDLDRWVKDDILRKQLLSWVEEEADFDSVCVLINRLSESLYTEEAGKLVRDLKKKFLTQFLEKQEKNISLVERVLRSTDLNLTALEKYQVIYRNRNYWGGMVSGVTELSPIMKDVEAVIHAAPDARIFSCDSPKLKMAFAQADARRSLYRSVLSISRLVAMALCTANLFAGVALFSAFSGANLLRNWHRQTAWDDIVSRKSGPEEVEPSFWQKICPRAAFDDVFFVNVALIIGVAYLAGVLPLSILCCQLFAYSVVLTKHAVDLQMFKIEGSSSKVTEKTFSAEFSGQELGLVHPNARLDGASHYNSLEI